MFYGDEDYALVPMSRVSAGLLMYRIRSGVQVLLVHPGGPFFQNKDEGAWSIPKGEIERPHSPVTGTGHPPCSGPRTARCLRPDDSCFTQRWSDNQDR